MRGGLVIALAVAGCGFRHGQAVQAASDTLSTDGSAWAHARTLTIDNAGLAALADFPLLVVLDSTRIDYASTSAAGSDLRFTDNSGAPLPYEIESWNPSDRSFVWVSVPAIAADTTTTITMLYGNPDAADGQQPNAVWDPGFLGVWHLADAHDSTGKHVSADMGSTATMGPVGAARAFAGSPQYIDTGVDDYLVNFTIECWMRPAAPATTAGPSGPLSRGLNYQFQWDCGSLSYCKTANVQNSGTPLLVTYGDPPDQVWSHIVATFDGTTLQTYLAGASAMSGTTALAPAQDTGGTKLGARVDLTYYFVGEVDEARISNVVRPAAYVTASHRAMTDTYVTFGPER
jgi:hypothetical protein